ncbi:nuclear transport factor 2 family protein [Rhizobium sp. SG2393]|uniref:nuclear transport factor 2 family protein n=1 Tax=Rhizobium sp. SG2393 TaxID=3276279 RepID=UPI00366B3401
MNMPDFVGAFFRAGQHDDADSLSQAFTTDAVVEDEKALHHGRDAIRTWWMAAKAASQFVVVPKSAVREGDTAVVRATVSGNFAGSPIDLTYTFTSEGGKISRLEIRP